MHSAGRFNGEQTYQLAIYSYISCKFHVNMIKCGLPTNTTQIKHNKVRIPTGGRLTSWLFTRRGGVEFGATKDKSIQWQGGGFEPGTSGLQVQHPTTRPRSPPSVQYIHVIVHMQVYSSLLSSGKIVEKF